jgi:hypothetical protein
MPGEPPSRLRFPRLPLRVREPPSCNPHYCGEIEKRTLPSVQTVAFLSLEAVGRCGRLSPRRAAGSSSSPDGPGTGAFATGEQGLIPKARDSQGRGDGSNLFGCHRCSLLGGRECKLHWMSGNTRVAVATREECLGLEPGMIQNLCLGIGLTSLPARDDISGGS